MFVTEPFSIKPASYVREVLWIWLARWWWALALPLALLLFFGITDLRLLIVALMLLLIVYPALLSLLYFSHVLKPDAAYCLIPHTVRYDDRGVTVTYVDHDSDYPLPETQFFSAAEIAAVEDSGDMIVIHYHADPYRLTIVPRSSILP